MIKVQSRQKFILTSVETSNNYQTLIQGYLDILLVAEDLDLLVNKYSSQRNFGKRMKLNKKKGILNARLNHLFTKMRHI